MLCRSRFQNEIENWRGYVTHDCLHCFSVGLSPLHCDHPCPLSYTDHGPHLCWGARATCFCLEIPSHSHGLSYIPYHTDLNAGHLHPRISYSCRCDGRGGRGRGMNGYCGVCDGRCGDDGQTCHNGESPCHFVSGCRHGNDGRVRANGHRGDR